MGTSEDVTFTLRDLEGKPGLTMAVLARSKAAAIRAVRQRKAVTAAGSTGAINIWRDNKGRLHAAFCRNLAYLDHAKFPRARDLDAWLKAWWPRMTEG